VARGMPTIVRLPTDTVEMFPHLIPRLRARSYHHRLTLSEVRKKAVGPAISDSRERLSLSPAQFCELLQVRAAPGADLCALVFPRVTGYRGGIEFELLSPSAAAARLTEGLFHADDPQKLSDVLDIAAGGGCTAGVGQETLSL